MAGGDEQAAGTTPGATRAGVAWPRYLEAGLGLKDYWYPVLFSRELAEGQVAAEEICGQRLLLKRTGGRVHAIADQCPHRGVAFSARPECPSANTVSCWFHGFTFDVRDGALVEVLSQPGSALVGRLHVPTYPVEEAFGLVWVFIGDGPPTDFAADLPAVLQRHFRGEERRAFFPVARVKIACDWRLAVENGFDPGHVYGHRNAEFVTGGYVKMPLAYYPESADTFTFETSPDQAAVMWCNHQRWTYVWEAEVEGQVVKPDYPGRRPDLAARSAGLTDDELARRRAKRVDLNLGIHLPCLLEVRSFPDGYQTHLEWFVPVDEHHHLYTIMASAVVDDDADEARWLAEERELWAPLVWAPADAGGGEGGVVGFNNYDAFGRAQVAHAYDQEDFWHREVLYKPDVAITEWRRFVHRQARGVMTRGRFQPRPEPEPSEVRFVYE